LCGERAGDIDGKCSIDLAQGFAWRAKYKVSEPGDRVVPDYDLEVSEGQITPKLPTLG